MFGIIECGRMLYTYHFVSDIAREGTRWASVRSTSTQTDIRNHVKDIPGAMAIDAAKMTVTSNWPGTSSPSCPAGTKKAGCVVSVEVEYAYTVVFPLLPASVRAFSMSS